MRLFYSDSLNFLRNKLSLRRLLNVGKLLASFYLTKWTGRPIQWGLPMTISIEPTTACNLRCPECPSGLRKFTRPTGNLKTGFFRKVIEELSDTLLYLIFYFQGEPYINPDFLEMVKHASEKGIYTITSTNGHFLDDENAKKTVESGLDRLIISIDGTTQEVYEQYRVGGDLLKVLDGTRKVVHWKKTLGSSTPHIVFQFLVVRPNQHQIADIQQLAREIGVDEVKLKTAQVFHPREDHPLIPTIDGYSRYRKTAEGRYELKNRLLNHCWKLWHSCVITWNGTVVPCCFDKDAAHPLGDLNQNPFKTTWQGEPYQQFRRTLLHGRARIDICRNCTEGCRVWA